MTSRRWLIKLMKQAAERKNVTFESIRQGGSHEIFQLVFYIRTNAYKVYY